MAHFPRISLDPDPNHPDQYRVTASIESTTMQIIKQIRDAQDSQARDVLYAAHCAGAAGVPFEVFVSDLIRRLGP